MVDFVRAGMVQIFALQINLRTALRQRFGMVERAGTADIGLLQTLHFSNKIGIADNTAETGLNFRHRHSQTRMVDFAPMCTEKAVLIRQHHGV